MLIESLLLIIVLENQNHLADLFGQKLKKKIFMNEIKVEIVADSINQQGNRLTSLVLTYPRIIHAEMMTHRMFSRNASSSRAVPVQKMIEAVRNNTFCPFEFQKAHKGMQGTEYFTGQDKEDCIKLWLESAELALQQAEKMKEKGITKQIINRILEPYQYYTVLITGSKEGWDNFFSLRSPSYEVGVNKFKSKKDVLDYYSDEPNYKELKNYTDLEWLQINKGQAEIHMMMLSEKIYDCIQESVPTQLKENEWHLPFEDKINELYPNLTLEDKNKVSVGMAANTSYTIVGDGSIITLEKATRIHDKCKELNHSSVFEHCARAMSDEEYYSFIKGKVNTGYIDESEHQIFLSNKFHNWGDYPELGWCNNLKGFISYRYFIDNKIEL